MSLQAAGDPAGPPEIVALGPWFHNLHLPGGVLTAPDHPLGDFPAFKWAELAPALPPDLAGRSALDIGCNAGFYSNELAVRGADVLGIDHDDHYLRQAEWATGRFGLGSRAPRFRRLGVYELPRLAEQFDLVLFMGVLYHLRYPLLALDLVAEHVRLGGTLVVQTLSLPAVEAPPEPPADLTFDKRHLLTDPGWPHMAFVEHELAGDPTNWWVPNHAAVEAMLRSAGMRVVDRPGDEMWVCERVSDSRHHSELEVASGWWGR